MGQGDGPGTGHAAATSAQGRERDAVVRCLERRTPHEGRAPVVAAQGVDRRDLQRVLVLEVRQDARQPLGEHRLARTRRSPLRVCVHTLRNVILAQTSSPRM